MGGDPGGTFDMCIHFDNQYLFIKTQWARGPPSLRIVLHTPGHVNRNDFSENYNLIKMMMLVFMSYVYVGFHLNV